MRLNLLFPEVSGEHVAPFVTHSIRDNRCCKQGIPELPIPSGLFSVALHAQHLQIEPVVVVPDRLLLDMVHLVVRNHLLAHGAPMALLRRDGFFLGLG